MSEEESKEELETLSASVHTHASFGRTFTAAAIAAASTEAERFAAGQPVLLAPTVTVKQLKGGKGAYVCVTIPGYGTFCKLQRND